MMPFLLDVRVMLALIQFSLGVITPDRAKYRKIGLADHAVVRLAKPETLPRNRQFKDEPFLSPPVLLSSGHLLDMGSDLRLKL